MAPSSSLQPPSSSFGGGGRRNPLTSGGAQPPATSSIPMLDSESSVRRRIAEGTDFGLSEAGVSQAGGSDLGTMNEARTRAARTTGEEVQEERTRRLRDQLGIAAREGRSKIRDDAAESFQTVFEHFLSTFEDVAAAQEDTQDEFGARVYARQLGRMRVDECATVFVDFGHVMQHDERAAQALVENYLRLEPYMGRAARRAYQKARRGLRADEGAMQGAGENLAIAVALFGLPATQRVRELRADKIGTLASVGGTVTRTSEVRPELVRGVFRCGACSGVSGAVTQQFKYTEPSICENALCQNRTAWTLVVEQSVFADWQRVRVQEHAAEIPPGSMPRTLDVVVRGDLVERVKPGDRALFTGALVALPDVSQLAGPGQTAEAQRDSGRAQGGGGGGVTGVQALGVRELTYRLAFVACHAQAAGADAAETGDAGDVGDARDAFLASLTRAEREELAAMGAGGDVYSRLAASIAPTVFGHDEVKRGILLQLLGGVHKRTREGMRLRGDINVCVVGDPSTAKSQFLKYVAGLLPRAVFTSGKASSAAGLTASVVRDDETGDFTVEAGALMLADHGVCCIDEFDKMDIADQVAIHEAMEQQTISIAKAGIHATLNARTSILAAANPVAGRYDRRLTLRQNVAMSAPIMSRFDLFFVVLDDPADVADYNTARHIVRVHQLRDDAVSPPFTPAALRRYIRFARTILPVLREDAARLLWESYRNLRQEDVGAGGMLGAARSTARNAYRITVRQLESLVRLSEALARAHCSDVITVAHVREAVRLLRRSIVHVEMDDVDVADDSAVGSTDSADHADSTGDVLARVLDAGDAPAAAQPLKVTIKREDFDRIRAMLVLKLHDVEEKDSARQATASTEPSDNTESPDSADSPDEGMRHADLIDWYLAQREDHMESELDFAAEQQKATMVLKYMLDVEGCVIALRNAEASHASDADHGTDAASAADHDTESRGPLLMLHPNFAIDS